MEINKKRKILVTGANGFIGCSLCTFLKEKGCFVRGAVRNNAHNVSEADEYIQVGDISELTDWSNALCDVDFVVHLAGRAHVMREQESDPDYVYHRINAMGTKRLAEQAVKSGIKRFIFISSIKANGKDPYGASKQEAENSLVCIAAETGLQVVILRLPLVYGPGVKANFRNLIKLVNSGVPLPFKNVTNRRSLIYLGNLLDAIITCVNHPLAAGEIFMLSDGQDISTPDLIKMIAFALGKRPLLFPLSTGILMTLCKIAGKGEEVGKLVGSLTVDSSKIRNLLSWKPPFTLEEGIKETIDHYIHYETHF
ncbi:MAG: NAD-dependent epimerase/dehydratase family protein [bacterium]